MKYLIDIYLEEWDYDARKLKGITNLQSGFYTSELTPRVIEKEFYHRMFSDAGDGIKLQSYEFKDFVFMQLVFLWKRDYKPVFEYINENFTVLDEKFEEFPLFNLDTNEYFMVGINENDNDEFLLDIIKDEKNIKAIRLKEIYEKGATGWEEAYLISISAGASIEIVRRLTKYIRAIGKERGFYDSSSDHDTNSLKINNELKKKVAELSNQNINNLYLSSFRWRQDEKVDIQFKSRYKLVFLTCDKKMNIEEFQIRDLTQTHI